MECNERRPSCLELTMAMPGLCTSPWCESGGSGGCNVRDLDMNKPAYGMEDFPTGSVEDDEDTSTPRPKKLRLSQQQSCLLEESFRQNHTLNPKQKEALASKLKLKPRQVEVWFQNRRARTKLKRTEVECEYLRRCFGSLTEENRRLQREVDELRALRAAPPAVLSPHTCDPIHAAALTMCPRCERVTTTGGGGGGAAAAGVHAQGRGAGPLAREVNPFWRPSAAC